MPFKIDKANYFNRSTALRRVCLTEPLRSANDMMVTRRIERLFSLCIALVFLGPVAALAQGTSNNGGSITLPGSSQPPVNGQTCVQVQIAGQNPSALNCLNQQLQQQVQAANPSQPNLPLAAVSSSNKVGTFNEQSVNEQYGQNFGKSVVPYRPPASTFNNPVRP